MKLKPTTFNREQGRWWLYTTTSWKHRCKARGNRYLPTPAVNKDEQEEVTDTHAFKTHLNTDWNIEITFSYPYQLQTDK